MHRLIQGPDKKKGEPDEHLSYFLIPFHETIHCDISLELP